MYLLPFKQSKMTKKTKPIVNEYPKENVRNFEELCPVLNRTSPNIPQFQKSPKEFASKS